MALTHPECTRLIAKAHRLVRLGDPDSLEPGRIAHALQSVRKAFEPDPARPRGMALLTSADVLVYGLAAVCRTTFQPPPDEEELGDLFGQLESDPANITPNAVERIVLRTARLGWGGGLEILRIWIGWVVEPFFWWAVKSHLSRDRKERRERSADWVKQESAHATEMVLNFLVDCPPCRCNMSSEQLSLKPALAERRCRDEHNLDSWDRKESLAWFLWKVVMYPVSPMPQGLNRFEQLIHFRLKRLRTNAFRHGILAKSAFGGGLHSGKMLRCPHPRDDRLPARPDGRTLLCGGRIDPWSDRCVKCNRVAVTPLPPGGLCRRWGCRGHLNPGNGRCGECGRLGKPYAFRWWLWRDDDLKARSCRLCETCGEYRFRDDYPCSGRQSGEPDHVWSDRNGPKVWVHHAPRSDTSAADATGRTRRVVSSDGDRPRPLGAAAVAAIFREICEAPPRIRVLAEILLITQLPMQDAVQIWGGTKPSKKSRQNSRGEKTRKGQMTYDFLDDVLAVLRFFPAARRPTDARPAFCTVPPWVSCVARLLFGENLSLEDVRNDAEFKRLVGKAEDGPPVSKNDVRLREALTGILTGRLAEVRRRFESAGEDDLADDEPLIYLLARAREMTAESRRNPAKVGEVRDAASLILGSDLPLHALLNDLRLKHGRPCPREDVAAVLLTLTAPLEETQ